jgi:acyl transferase domain-containing protein/acyl carrier protein
MSNPSLANAIAVVGMAGRFPGAANIEQFWKNLCDGVESIATLSDEQMLASGVSRSVLNDPHLVRRMGVLEKIDEFDASFFGYSRREAAVLDPQQRLFLECAWHAIEHAGHDPKACPGNVGVYAGAAMNRYLLHHLQTYPGAVEKLGELELLLGGEKDFLATRVAYKLNLRGPAVTVLTACSTSLTAVVMAYQSLLTYGCDMALAGGVSVHVPSHCGYTYQQGGTLSPDGKCRAFDADARGMVPGDGVAVVVLKRLSDAIANNDTIYAIVRGAAINNDGSGKIGYTAPSAEGQAQVIAMAQALADVEPRSIGYIEAHGTGTELGDPIEIAGLTQAFGSGIAHGSIAVGSVKTNVGHLDSAAGVTGFIKTVLTLHHRQIPPSLHFECANPKLGLERTPFYVNTSLKPFPAIDGSPRRAGVSSFGIGGTNAHVVLEEVPPRTAAEISDRTSHLLVLSARSESALESTRKELAAHLSADDTVDLADVAYTLQVGRRPHPHRLAIACSDREDAVRSLLDPATTNAGGRVADGAAPEVVFLFPGQGSQHVGMAQSLYRQEPLFRAEVDRCCEILGPLIGADLREILWPGSSDDAAAQRLDQTAITQPALFTIEYALARLWMHWGVKPSAMVGHSIGEYVAACLAGVFTLEDALKVVADRGRLMQSMPPGAMLAVQLPADRVSAMIAEPLSIAVINDASSCVVAGPIRAIQSLAAELSSRGVAARMLRTSHAFHSSMMEDVLAPFEDLLGRVRLSAPSIRIASNLTGGWLSDAQATDPRYWSQHLRKTVQFHNCLGRVLGSGRRSVLLEVGPGTTLTTLASRHEQLGSGKVIASSRHPKQQLDDLRSLHRAAGGLWCEGVTIDWHTFTPDAPRRRVALPGYPFERERHWLGDLLGGQRETSNGASRVDDEQPAHARGASFHLPAWRQQTRLADLNELRQHPQRWLVLHADDAASTRTSQSLTQRLEQLSQRWVAAAVGPADLESLNNLCGPLGGPPDIIVDLCDLDAGATDVLSSALDATLRVQQVARLMSRSCSAKLLCVTQNVHSVAGETSVGAGRAAAMPATRVAAREIPGLAARAIDFAGEVSVEGILTEAMIDADEPIVAYRGHSRFVRGVQEIPLKAPTTETSDFKAGGCYVITGGLGGIGLAIAEALARRFHARLVLIGRSEVPPRDHWSDSHLSTADAATRRRIESLRRIESMGGTVMTASADVSDPGQTFDAIKSAVARFGAIDGVIHAAGIAPGGSLMLRNRDDISAVISAKVGGAIAIEDALRRTSQTPRFIAHCSSLAALIGVPGQIDYSAANAVLDAMAQHADSRQLPRILSINWDTWSETGMAARAADQPGLGAAQQEALRNGLATDEAVEAFFGAVESGFPQVIIASRPVEPRLGIQAFAARQDQAEPAAAPAPSVIARQTANIDATPPSPAERIAQIWREFLGVRECRLSDDFFEMGGHSLLAVQMVHRIQESFDIEIGPDAIFASPTLGGLTSHVQSLVDAKSVPPAEPSESLLAMVESLSDEQVQALLEQELSGR